MNPRSFYSGLIRSVAIIAASLGLLTGANAATNTGTTNQPAAPALTTTNAAPKLAPIEIPISQFTIPTTIAEGRNPFFPDSIMSLKIPVVNTNSATKVVSVSLILQGISGTGAKRFALINGRTFEAGEDADVTVGRSKVHVHCLNIREDGVTVEVDGNRQELKLRPGL